MYGALGFQTAVTRIAIDPAYPLGGRSIERKMLDCDSGGRHSTSLRQIMKLSLPIGATNAGGRKRGPKENKPLVETRVQRPLEPVDRQRGKVFVYAFLSPTVSPRIETALPFVVSARGLWL